MFVFATWFWLDFFFFFFFFSGEHKYLEKHCKFFGKLPTRGPASPGSAQPAVPQSGGQCPTASLSLPRAQGHRHSSTAPVTPRLCPAPAPPLFLCAKLRLRAVERPHVYNLKVAPASSSRAGAAQRQQPSDPSAAPPRGSREVPARGNGAPGPRPGSRSPASPNRGPERERGSRDCCAV